MLIRTEAIVLRSVNYGETSQIVTLFTRQMGTVAVMAKGARGPKSRFGSALQPMSHVQVVFYYKNSRDVHTLSECTHVTMFRRLWKELDRMSIGIRMVELVGILMRRPEPDEQAFDTLLEVLTRLDRAERHWLNLLPYFELQLTASLGFAPAIDADDVRQIGEAGGFIDLTDGNVSESKPGATSSPASRRAIRAIGVLVHAELDTVMRMNLDRSVYLEVVQLIESYLRYHVEDYRASRSKTVFDRIL